MSAAGKPPNATRRAFVTAGAVLAAPLAAAAPVAVMAEEQRKSRLARLEAEAEIRALHQAWLRHVNTGARDDAARLFADPTAGAFDPDVRSLVTDHAAAPETIEIAADGLTASGRYPCVAEVTTDLAEDCTLAQMAHLQGGGLIRTTERRVVKAQYVKTGAAWAIAKIDLASA